MINKVIIIGRLTRDVELKMTSSGIPVCSFTVAIDNRMSRDAQEKTTAQIVSQYLNVPVEYSDKFRELNKGLLTGMEREKAQQLYPKYMGKVAINDSYPGGESMMDMYERVGVLLKEIEDWDKVLIVTHRGVINMIYFILENRLPDLDKKQFGVTHASVHQYDVKKKMIKKIGGK